MTATYVTVTDTIGTSGSSGIIRADRVRDTIAAWFPDPTPEVATALASLDAAFLGVRVDPVDIDDPDEVDDTTWGSIVWAEVCRDGQWRAPTGAVLRMTGHPRARFPDDAYLRDAGVRVTLAAGRRVVAEIDAQSWAEVRAMVAQEAADADVERVRAATQARARAEAVLADARRTEREAIEASSASSYRLAAITGMSERHVGRVRGR